MVENDRKKNAKAAHVSAANAFEAAEILYGSQLYAECAILLRRYINLEYQALLWLTEKGDAEAQPITAKSVVDSYAGSTLLRGLQLEEIHQRIDAASAEAERVKGDSHTLRNNLSNVFREIETFFARCDRFVRRATLTAKQAKLRRTIRRAAVSAVIVAAVAYAGYYYLFLANRGIRGSYYRGRNFDSFVVTREDPNIDFDFRMDRPRGVPENDFTVRWEGMIHAPEDGSYEITAHVDDGARVFIDGKTVVDHWVPSAPADRSGSIELQAGWHDIKVEYFQDRYSALIRLYWKPPGQKRTLVPRSSLRAK